MHQALLSQVKHNSKGITPIGISD